MNNLDRDAAELRLKEMEKQIEELRTMLNKSVDGSALINLSGGDYYVLFGRGGCGTFEPQIYADVDLFTVKGEWYALFEDEAQAGAYGKAFAILAELRRQPGTITPVDRSFGDDGTNWVIIPKLSDDNRVSSVDLDYWNSKVNAMSCISPVFKSRELAEAAIARIGPATLAQMFKTFHHDE